MKKFILTAFMTCVSLWLFAQTDFFYSSGGKKESFKIRKDKVILKAKSENETKMLSKQNVLFSAHNLNNNMLVASIDTLTMNVENLAQRLNVADISYALEYSDGTLQMLTNQIFAKIKEGQTIEQCLENINPDNVEKIEIINQNNMVYLITLNIKTGKILQVCRDLFETGMFEFIEPSFVREIKPFNTHYSSQWA